ncbi:hypothetical protein H7U32_05150 [Bifidobacterium pullorum subsp. saeculare]|uniref:Uncharacterized protein n=1 Tax=Bifidobacterium pullorum subsp. saeculare TaxID=78257 RepID=A0A939B9X3_9BIFI|nr:hypothetical protein [Bifidobacterium pullorum subsp. saeculare]
MVRYLPNGRSVLPGPRTAAHNDVAHDIRKKARTHMTERITVKDLTLEEKAS